MSKKALTNINDINYNLTDLNSLKVYIMQIRNSGKISKVFVRNYLISMARLTPYSYRENLSSLAEFVFYKQHITMLQHSGLAQYLAAYGINANNLVLSTDYTNLVRSKSSGIWKLLILPWLFLITDEKIFAAGIEALHTEKSPNQTRDKYIAYTFLEDYLMHNNQYHIQDSKMNMMINNIFALFNDVQLLQYRRYLCNTSIKYAIVNADYYLLSRILVVDVIPQIYIYDELATIRDKSINMLINIRLYRNYDVISDLINCIRSWNIGFTNENLQQLIQFVYKKLKRKRTNISGLLRLIRYIDNVLNEYNIDVYELKALEARKFTMLL